MTEELKKEILDILDNVYYWETCPQEYNDRIDAVKKQLTIPVVSDMFSAEKVEDAYSDGLDYGMGNGGLKFHLENYR